MNEDRCDQYFPTLTEEKYRCIKPYAHVIFNPEDEWHRDSMDNQWT